MAKKKPTVESGDPMAAGDVGDETTEEKEKRGRQSVAPFCPHHPTVQCESRHSSPVNTYYYCPVEGCVGSAEITRPRPPRMVPEAENDCSAR